MHLRIADHVAGMPQMSSKGRAAMIQFYSKHGEVGILTKKIFLFSTLSYVHKIGFI